MRKNKKKKLMAVAVFMVCLAIMTSCKGNNASKETIESQSGIEENQEDLSSGDQGLESQEDTDIKESNTEQETPGNNAEKDTGKGSQTTPDDTENGQKKELPIYTIDDDTLSSQAYNAEIPAEAEVTAKLVVDTVVQTFAADNITIGIDGVTQNGGTVTVSFQSNHAPMTDVGASEESAILDCISMSLLDNLEDCKEVIFQVEGGAYVSGHFEFKQNEVYKWK